MKIYIASSWRNQLAVELLTMELRRRGHSVHSFVEQALEDELVFDDPNWIWTEQGRGKFEFDIAGASESELVIYIGPSGTDAWAEVGVAYANNIPVIGFYAKGEGQGLMQRMMRDWHQNAAALLRDVSNLAFELGEKHEAHI